MFFLLGFGSLGLTEILLLLIVAIIVFGASRLPELGKGLGQGIVNFKKGLKGDDDKGAPPPKP